MQYTRLMQHSKLSPFTVYYDNAEEYHHLKGEIFTQDTYYFECDTATPRIIDAGAHIGLATLYFKKLFPAAYVTAIEPHPHSFKLLEKNIWENSLTDVSIIRAALGDRRGERSFFADASKDKWFSTAGFLSGAWTGSQTSSEQSVEIRPLADFLQQPVDFLKMDIEGAEEAVLMMAGAHIQQVKQMRIEFHTHPSQKLSHLLDFLQDYHFKIQLWKKGKPVTLKQAHGLVMIEAHQVT